MGFFSNETESEKKFKDLIRIIRGATNINFQEREYLAKYVSDVKDGKRNNDFHDFDFLRQVILDCINENNEHVDKIFEQKIEQVEALLPMGIETEDYEGIRNMILTNKADINMSLYTLFTNRIDYIQIMKIIKSNNFSKSEIDIITGYALEASPYCINQGVLKNEILSFIDGLKNEYGSIDEYVEKRLTEAKKRCGVYPIDEKTLALIASEARKAQELIAKLEAMQKKVDDYEDRIKAITQSGKDELTSHATTKVKEMTDNITTAKNDIISKLDEYLLMLQENLKNSSDQVFNNILIQAQNQLRDIKLTAQNLSTTTTKELLRIQQASEESVDALKKYVDSEPQLQQLLKEAADSESIKEALLQLGELNKEVTVVQSSAPGIIIPGNDRLVVPASANVVLPNGEVNDIILPAFDENIPFDIRYKRILDEKKRRENEGEIFHSMIDEVINCVMEGDWVYLWGPSGCGKSHIIKQVASLIGIDLIENGKITDKYSIMAYNDPHGRFRATQAFVALVYGKLLSLDEFDNGNPDTQVVLNELYSGSLDAIANPNKKRFVTFAEDMTVAINPNFRMISAGNTSGEGENQIFSSRGKLDESVQQRMTPKKFDYDNRVEERIFGSYTEWYNLFVNFRKICDSYAKRQGQSTAVGIVTTRDAAAIVKYINHDSKSVDQILREKFIQTKDASYLGFIAKSLQDMYDIREITNPEIDTPLKEVKEKVLARKLAYGCTNEVKRNNR